MKASQKLEGSVVYNRVKETWNYLYFERGKRTSKKLEVPAGASREEALREAYRFRRDKRDREVKVKALVESYMRSEAMPKRWDSYRVYKSNLEKWILPEWGEEWVSELRDHPTRIKLWLAGLRLAPMSKARLRAIMQAMFNYAMDLELIPFGVNPMTRAKVQDPTLRVKTPWSMSKEQFDRWIFHLEPPFSTIALVSLGCCLRISEALALKWRSIDWLNQKLPIRKGMVNQHFDDVKSKKSRRTQHLIPEMVEVLKQWKAMTDYGDEADWIFASPYQQGRLPYSYMTVLQKFKQAAERAGVRPPPDENGTFGTHLMRHTARTWVKEHTKEADVQRQLFGHSTVAINQDVYGEVLPEEVKRAQEGLGKIIFGGSTRREQ